MITGKAYLTLQRVLRADMGTSHEAHSAEALREFEALRASHTELLAALQLVRTSLCPCGGFDCLTDESRAVIAALVKAVQS
jgi:hypothetical protein